MSADSLSGLRESFAIQMVCCSSPSYDRTELPTAKLYRDSLAKRMSKAKPSLVSFEGFVVAMVMVDGLRKAGADLMRDKFVDAIESMHNVDIGLGRSAHLMYGRHHHQGLDHVYPTVVRGGRPEFITDWQAGVKQKQLPDIAHKTFGKFSESLRPWN